MPTRPLLRQAGELTSENFDAHPVWVHCHIVDYDEPWYDDTDEETFRPWDGALPVDPAHTIFLVAAQLEFADGSKHPGFMTPSAAPDDLATMQPHVFVGRECFGFWGGMPGIREVVRLRFYRVAGEAARVFPIMCTASSLLARGVVSCTINGFYRYDQGASIVYEE
jgi:hypothetical protein